MPWLLEFLIGVQNVPEGSACDPPDVCTSLWRLVMLASVEVF
jgi:hypothetical protein